MKRLLLFLLAWLVFISAFSQETDENSLIEPISETLSTSSSIFTDEKPLNLTLKYDITSFIKHKNKGEYLDAVLTIHESETDSIVKNIRLKARGNFRRGYCFFPPIYLNFKTDPIENTDLKDINKVKLVTHCSSSKSYQNYILKEYLAYKLYNTLSDYSFRVKLVNVNYIDTGLKGRNYYKKGFLIEPVELLARRTNSVEVDTKLINGNNVKEKDVDRVALFEYLIANSDWRIKTGHNMKYLKSMDDITTKVIPVPYDFDYSGIVNASYAVPQEWTSLKTVTEREYLGYCRTNDNMSLQTIDLFVQNRDKIYSVISGFQYLDEKEKRRMINFVKEFYDEAGSPGGLLKTLKKECRGLDF